VKIDKYSTFDLCLTNFQCALGLFNLLSESLSTLPTDAQPHSFNTEIDSESSRFAGAYVQVSGEVCDLFRLVRWNRAGCEMCNDSYT